MKSLVLLGLMTLSTFVCSQKIQPSLKFANLDRKKIPLNEYLSKGPVLINFWATWCGPCKKEMIHLDRLGKKYQNKGFTILSVSIDTQRSLPEVKRYVRSKRFSFEVFVDPNQQIFKKLNGNIMPTNILVEQDGTVAWIHYGYIPGDEVNMEKKIVEVLNK